MPIIAEKSWWYTADYSARVPKEDSRAAYPIVDAGCAMSDYAIEILVKVPEAEAEVLPDAPTLTALQPDTAVLGTADITMVCEGTNFVQNRTVIVFTVRTEGVGETGSLPFTFTEA